MKHLKILGLLAVAVTAMMAFAATASATIITSPDGTVYTGAIKATNENGHVSLHNETANIECASSVEGSLATHGAGVTAKGSITHLTFTGCTGGWTVTVNAPGELEAHTVANPVSGKNDATLTSSGATVTAVSSIFGITCRYTTLNTHVGTVTSSTTLGGAKATLDIKAQIPFHSGSIFCGGTSSAWTGSYVINTPTTLDID